MKTEWRLRVRGWPAVFTIPAATIDPTVVEGIEQAASRHGLTLERVDPDPRFSDEPVGMPEIAGLTVAFKALVHRAGGEVEFTTGELHHAEGLLVCVEADPERMSVRILDGEPPPVPVFAAEQTR